MATKDARGNKLTCQNEECGSRFYDLNRDPPECPICATVYVIEQPAPPPEPEAQKEASKEEKPASGADKVAKDDPDAEAVDELADIETDDAISDDDADDTFLESDDEEEGGDVTGIVNVKKDDVD